MTSICGGAQPICRARSARTSSRIAARRRSSPSFAAGIPTTVTGAERTLQAADWLEVRDLAQKAEAIGFEALVPIGRWKGFGGPSGYWDRSFDTFSWAAGVAAVTSRIQIFTTVHVNVIIR